MFYLGLVLFVLGFAAYVVALFHVGHPDGDTYSDIGNALMLTTAVLLLLRLSWRFRSSGAPGSRRGGEPPKPGYQA